MFFIIFPQSPSRGTTFPRAGTSGASPSTHVQLLSTPPCGDAVAFGFRPKGHGPGGTFAP